MCQRTHFWFPFWVPFTRVPCLDKHTRTRSTGIPRGSCGQLSHLWPWVFCRKSTQTLADAVLKQYGCVLKKSGNKRKPAMNRGAANEASRPRILQLALLAPVFGLLVLGVIWE